MRKNSKQSKQRLAADTCFNVLIYFGAQKPQAAWMLPQLAQIHIGDLNNISA